MGDLAGVELAGEGLRAEQRGVAPLLVAPGGHGERPARADIGLPQGVQALETRQHAEGAVQGAALGHGIDMGARHHRGGALAEPPEGIARLVHPGRQPRVLHPRDEPGARLFVGRAPAGAGDALACRVPAELREGLEVGAETGERDREPHGRGSVYKTSLTLDTV